MGRVIGFLAVAIVVVILLIGGVLWFQSTWIVSKYLSANYGAGVTVQSVSWGPRKVVVRGFKIENREGSVIPYAFTAERVQIDVAPWKLLKTDTYIPRIDFKGVTMGIELYDLKGNDNNWARLLARMDEDRDRDHQYFVETVTVDRIDIQAYSYALKEHLDVQPIENLVLTEVDPDKPLDLGPISAAVYRAMLRKIAEKAPGPLKVLGGALNILKGKSGAEEPQQATEGGE